MNIIENSSDMPIPVYEVEEVTVKEALLMLAEGKGEFQIEVAPGVERSQFAVDLFGSVVFNSLN
ncbi:hypothetical protein [Candidatus Endoriftia persephone]|jgi:hypothetical protein|nr:hypothetical protein [Candidatus Endoriftia persephone]EGV50239.1 hypothetical protein Rifp1Sym_dr00100 [endosymbiont of Riftia pachyptila (vent Ph05)]USF87171.1 adhesin [Candidatus Endoriftia persephone]